MKSFNFLTGGIVLCILLLFFSCEESTDDPDKKVDDVIEDTTNARPLQATPAAKLSYTLIITHKVADFEKWKSAYDAHDSLRLAYGLHNYILSRGANDSNMVMIDLKMDDENKAKEFAAMPDLKADMQKGEVMGMPSFNFVDVQMLDTLTNALSSRVIITHRVKDWDAWKKEFDAHKQARMDAGLTDRAVGHSVGDNHNVTIVCTVNDMKKAEAFMSSPNLKNAMAKAGVEGPPNIFFYNVVQRY